MSTTNLATTIRDTLWKRGWLARGVLAKHVHLKECSIPDGLLKCVDGRPGPMATSPSGPKILGGPYAIASMRQDCDTPTKDVLKKAAEDVIAAGYVPVVHGDTEHHGLGCGYLKLWKEGLLPDVYKPVGCGKEDFTPKVGKDVIMGLGGHYEILEGRHWESQVLINLVPGTTSEPNEWNQQFVVDAWFPWDTEAKGFEDLDRDKYLKLAVSTVEQLSNTCRTALIVVKDEEELPTMPPPSDKPGE